MIKDRDVICFLGDSITANGSWMAEIYQYLRVSHELKIYNCGVSGSTANNAVKYMHANCLIHNPDYVVIMFGVNDIARDRYASSVRDNPDAISVREAAKATHKAKYLEIIDNVIASGAQPVLCTPVPYDEVTVSDVENLCCQCALDDLADYVRKIADDNGYPIIDFSKNMKPMLGERPIISSDRVHPTSIGYHVMAQIFLREIGAIKNCDYDTPFVFEEWNRERYAAEQKLHMLKFVEFCSLLNVGWSIGATSEEKKALAMKKYEAAENKESFPARSYLYYVDNIDSYSRLLGEVVRLTRFK